MCQPAAQEIEIVIVQRMPWGPDCDMVWQAGSHTRKTIRDIARYFGFLEP
jgi:hypothetical protein